MSRGISSLKIIAALLLAALASLSCSSKREYIPERTVAEIMEKMWLADQYYQLRRNMASQLDSVNMYASIIEDYGYTIEDYRNSVTYYLTRPHGISDIITIAHNNLKEKAEELAKLVGEMELAEQMKWSGRDSIETLHVDSLIHHPGMRSIKWLCQPTKIVCNPMQSLEESDIPSNPIWWQKNIEEAEYPSTVVLIKDFKSGAEAKSSCNIPEDAANRQTDEDDNFPSDEAIKAMMEKKAAERQAEEMLEEEKQAEEKKPYRETRTKTKVVKRYNNK